MSQKFEKLIELIINEDEQAARNLFHEIVVEKSKEIYESLDEELDETKDEDLEESFDDIEEGMGGDKVNSMMDEIAADEQAGVAEDDMEPEMADGDELGEPDMHGGDDMDDMGGDEFGVDGEEGEIEDRVVDLEDALDELKAEFAKLMDEEPGEDDTDFGDEEGMDDMGADADGDKMPEGFVREYVEKVKAPSNTEEGSVNKRSTQITGKNDMGGTTANIAKGSAEEKGRSAPSTQALIGKVQNTAGGKKDLSAAPKPKTSGEDGGVNKKSPLAR